MISYLKYQQQKFLLLCQRQPIPFSSVTKTQSEKENSEREREKIQREEKGRDIINSWVKREANDGGVERERRLN